MICKKEILVAGGRGGDGCISFRREKYVPFGGPDGGDGGCGGDVVVAVRSDAVDLSSMQWQKEFVAANGRRGESGRKHGKKGEDLVISVPAGTMVFTKGDSGEDIFWTDLCTPGQKIVVAKGGRGGLGNARFATASRQAPEIASKGEPGEKRYIILELKLITDICIVGQPNSGKSTLLSAISGARPEIADYPFTTRQPVLGVMPDAKRDFIVAEIPGLIRGAHLGKGLGNEFLCHVERTKLLIYLLDGSSPTVLDDLNQLDTEIALYKRDLSKKLKIMVVNKIDLPEVQARLPDLRQSFDKIGAPVFYISAIRGQAVLELRKKAMQMVNQASRDEEKTSQAQIAVFRPKPRQ
ncbi:MAG: GTPase ObgE [Dehalococcoidia bacterium]|nr:GTPase ObgE [Dehalococcoidia bacterium]